jgi:hypothetical protein
MQPFINGVAACGSFVAATLFLRFWRDTDDRLFLWFALAFAMFTLNWSAIALRPSVDEARYLYFVPRLVGFLLILWAIVDRNRSQRRKGSLST